VVYRLFKIVKTNYLRNDFVEHSKRSIIFTNIPAPSDYEDGVQSLVAHVLENKQMSDTIQTDLDTLKQEFATLSASFEALKSEKEALALLLEETKSKAQVELEAFQKENSELKASIDSLKLEYQTLTRETELTSEGLAQDKASASAKLYINLTDEQWAPVKEALVAAAKSSTSTVVDNGTQTPQQVLASVEPVDNASKAQVNVDTTTPSKEEEYSELQKIIANLINVNIDGDKK
jgi:chromosome segregation ATPase